MNEFDGRSLEEYKVLGCAIKESYKNLKLIQKILSKIGYDKRMDNTNEDFIEYIEPLLCDLLNLASTFEAKMDEDFPDNITESINYFN